MISIAFALLGSVKDLGEQKQSVFRRDRVELSERRPAESLEIHWRLVSISNHANGHFGNYGREKNVTPYLLQSLNSI